MVVPNGISRSWLRQIAALAKKVPMDHDRCWVYYLGAPVGYANSYDALFCVFAIVWYGIYMYVYVYIYI